MSTYYHESNKNATKRRLVIFKINKFLVFLKEHNVSIEKVATIIGVSKTTLYCKINGKSDFYRSEIQAITRAFPDIEIESIFLPQKLRKRNEK